MGKDKELRKCGSSWEYCDGECDICATTLKLLLPEVQKVPTAI